MDAFKSLVKSFVNKHQNKFNSEIAEIRESGRCDGMKSKNTNLSLIFQDGKQSVPIKVKLNQNKDLPQF